MFRIFATLFLDYFVSVLGVEMADKLRNAHFAIVTAAGFSMLNHT